MCGLKVEQIPSSSAVKQKFYHSKLKPYTVLNDRVSSKKLHRAEKGIPFSVLKYATQVHRNMSV